MPAQGLEGRRNLKDLKGRKELKIEKVCRHKDMKEWKELKVEKVCRHKDLKVDARTRRDERT